MNVGTTESAPLFVALADPAWSRQNLTGPLSVTPPTPVLVLPSEPVVDASSHRTQLAMLRGLKPVARGTNSLGFMGMVNVAEVVILCYCTVYAIFRDGTVNCGVLAGVTETPMPGESAVNRDCSGSVKSKPTAGESATTALPTTKTCGTI